MSNPFDETTWNDKDRYYYRYLSQMLNNGVDAQISNADPEHVAYLFRELLTRTKKFMRLFTGELSADRSREIFESPEIAYAANRMLSQDQRRLIIVVDEASKQVIRCWEDQILMRSIRKSRKQGNLIGKMEIRRANAEATAFLKERNHYYPLMVMDDAAYRVETGAPLIPAHVNFGDTKGAREYADFFDDVLYRDSQEIVTVSGRN